MALAILGVILVLVLGALIGRGIYRKRAYRAGRLKRCPHCGGYYQGNPTYCPHCGEVVVRWSGRR